MSGNPSGTEPTHPVCHYRERPGAVDGMLTVHDTHSDPRVGLRQRVYRVTGSAELPGPGPDRLETLFVVSGQGTLVPHGAGAELPLRAERAALLVGDEPCRLDATGELVLVSVSADQDGSVPSEHRVPVIDLAEQAAGDAVSQREFRLLYCPDSGCSGVTQFVGYIPPIRTPEHYHPYSEMIFVLAGHGSVEIEGRPAEIGPGSCFYLPAGLPHVVQNLGTGFLRLLGVFTPAGSPAENTAI